MLLFSSRNFLTKSEEIFFTSSPHFTLSAADFCSVLAVEKRLSFPAGSGVIACTILTDPPVLTRDPGTPCSFTAHFYQLPHPFQSLQLSPFHFFLTICPQEQPRSRYLGIPCNRQPERAPSPKTHFPKTPPSFLRLTGLNLLNIGEVPEGGIPQH